MKQSQWVEYPKMVYTPGLEKHVVIHSKDEWPDGYFEHGEAVQMAESVSAQEDTELAQAKQKAKAAKKEERDAIKAYLDEHSVDYAPNLSTPKLIELKVALDKHLAAATEDQDDDSIQHNPVGFS